MRAEREPSNIAGHCDHEWSIADALLAALAYADVFGWPLTVEEIQRTLPVTATIDQVREALRPSVVPDEISCVDGMYVLWGDAGLVAERRRRTAASARLWPHALRCGRIIARLPFVRMVAVSGSLAVGAADADADIDLFVVTADDRLWTVRTLVIGVVRGAAVLPTWRRSPLCPNYLVVDSALELSDRDCFTAHELAQLVPLSGAATYDELLRVNAWYRDHLPNHVGNGPPRLAEPVIGARRLEPLLRRSTMDRFERWQMQRKIAHLTGGAPIDDVRYDERTCKGHVDGHRQRILDQYQTRLERLGVRA
jgi:hypothetical protein